MIKCEFCDLELDPRNKHATLQYVSGWARNRDQGGTNALHLKEMHPRFACRECIDRKVRGIDPNQSSFF